MNAHKRLCATLVRLQRIKNVARHFNHTINSIFFLKSYASKTFTEIFFAVHS